MDFCPSDSVIRAKARREHEIHGDVGAAKLQRAAPTITSRGRTTKGLKRATSETQHRNSAAVRQPLAPPLA